MTFKAPFILTAFIQLHYHSLQVQHFKICILLKEVNCRGLTPTKNIRYVGKEDCRGENTRYPATVMQVRCLTPHLNVVLTLLRTKNLMWKNWNSMHSLYMESSRAKQIKDEIHYYLPQLKSIGLIIILHILTINNVIFTKYLYNCNIILNKVISFSKSHRSILPVWYM